jgi:hypothetical protein
MMYPISVGVTLVCHPLNETLNYLLFGRGDDGGSGEAESFWELLAVERRSSTSPHAISLQLVTPRVVGVQFKVHKTKQQTQSPLVRKRAIPAERPPLADEI